MSLSLCLFLYVSFSPFSFSCVSFSRVSFSLSLSLFNLPKQLVLLTLPKICGILISIRPFVEPLLNEYLQSYPNHTRKKTKLKIREIPAENSAIKWLGILMFKIFIFFFLQTFTTTVILTN